MKKKLLLGLVLASVASANSFAMVITHGKLISHKEWTKGNIRASFKDIQSNSMALKPTDDSMTDFVSANSSTGGIGPVDGPIVINQNVSIWGDSTVNIANYSPVQKTYVITTSLAIAPPCASMTCLIAETAYSQDTVILDPNGGSVQFNRSPNVTMNFSSAGNGWFMVGTSVQVDGGTVFTAPSGIQSFTVNSAQK